MSARLAIDTLKPAQLDASSRTLWSEFRATDPVFRSPYFDLRYALVAGDSAPGAEIAMISRGGRVEGLRSSAASSWTAVRADAAPEL